jgi:hypothetical protein
LDSSFSISGSAFSPTQRRKHALDECRRKVAGHLTGDGMTHTQHRRISENFENKLETAGLTSDKINLKPVRTSFVKFPMPNFALAQ